MKKILVISAVFATVFLIVSCGGSTQNKSEASGNGEKPDSDEQDSEADGSAECKSGDFKCADSESLYCNSFGSWVFDARCENGCDPATGKCKTDSNESDIAADTENENDVDYENDDTFDSGNDSDIDSSNTGSDSDNGHDIPDDSGCTNGKYKCIDWASWVCTDSHWNFKETCEYGCDSATGKCKSSECIDGKYECRTDYYSKGHSYYCDNGLWEHDLSCENGCDSSTGKCKDMCYEIDNKTWSYSRSSMTWEAAQEFCDNMVNCGYSDWHLPTISELRTLIQNCPATETGGECGVTDQCLSYHQCSYIHNDDNSIISLCIGCSDSDSYYSGKYSKFGDNDWFWSSSFQDDTDSIQVWGVYFAMGTITSFGTNEYTLESVRCVR
jgi:hypothetical protein